MLPSIWIATHTHPAVIGVVLFALTTGMVLLIRWIEEGEAYDVAFSSFPGDASLALYCGSIATICQKQLPDGIHMIPEWNSATAIASILAGLAIHCAGFLGKKSHAWNSLGAQKYHNIVVIPLLSYSVISTLPIVWHGNDIASATSAIGFVLFWICAFFVDLTRGNLNPSKNPRMIEATRNLPLM